MEISGERWVGKTLETFLTGFVRSHPVEIYPLCPGITNFYIGSIVLSVWSIACLGTQVLAAKGGLYSVKVPLPLRREASYGKKNTIFPKLSIRRTLWTTVWPYHFFIRKLAQRKDIGETKHGHKSFLTNFISYTTLKTGYGLRVIFYRRLVVIHCLEVRGTLTPHFSSWGYVLCSYEICRRL